VLTASAEPKVSAQKAVAAFSINLVLVGLVVVIAVKLLGHPYGIYRYRLPQLMAGSVAIGMLLLATLLVRTYRARQFDGASPAVPRVNWRNISMLSLFPFLALVHLSMGIHEGVSTSRDPSLRSY